MSEFLRTLWQDESGQDLAEYVMLIALIAIAVVAAVGVFAGDLSNAFESISAELFPIGGDT